MTNTLIFNTGKDLLFDRMYNSATTKTVPSKMRFGIVQSDMTVVTTGLDNPATITGTETVDSCDATTSWTGSTDVTFSVNSTTYKEGTGALNIIKAGTTESTITITKTTTSLTFTDKYLHSWVYINTTNVPLLASGTAIEIRYGNDSSNYWYKQWTKAQYEALQVGSWADLRFDDSESSTGSPSTSACDYYQLRITLTATSETISVGEVILDFLRLASDDDYLVSMDSGFPYLDTTNREVTRQHTLNTVKANGYDIDGFTEENTDATPVKYGGADFTAQSKSNTEIFIFTVKDRIL